MSKKKTDLEESDLTGPVRQVKQTFFKARGKAGAVVLGKQDGDTYDGKNFIRTFDEKGVKIRDLKYSANGAGYQGNYNTWGKESEMFSYKAGYVLDWKGSATFDDKGRALVTTVVNPDDSFKFKTVYAYDENGNMIEYKHLQANETHNRTTVYKYENNKRTEIISTKADGTIEFWDKTVYNDKGNMLESIKLNADGSVREIRDFRQYLDSEGNTIKQPPAIAEEEDLDPETYAYEKDEHGNWIKKTVFYNDFAVSVYLREIRYFGGPDTSDMTITFEIPQTSNKNNMKLINKKENPGENSGQDLDPAQMQWVAEGSSADVFSGLRYYVAKNNAMPSQHVFGDGNYDAIAVMGELKEYMYAQVVHEYSMEHGNGPDRLVRYTLSFPDTGYLLQASQIQRFDDDDYLVPEFVESHYRHKDRMGSVNLSQMTLLYPSDASGMRDESFESELKQVLYKCRIKKRPDKPRIYMVEVEQGQFSLTSHPVNDDFEIKDLDVNYGSGFAKFHAELMDRFRTQSKGLVLFHGQPGTGKTYYIRHLLRKMTSHNKIVIYMPPNMVDHLVEPSFMTFLSNQLTHYSSQGYFCALLIEDAEPLLAKRQEGVRIQGVTNLLNMTDGLLNDMLNLKIICTFNVDLRKLDSALLRPGRLIARKEFKALSELDANLLAQRLGIKHHFTKSASLGEIYSLRKNQNTLIHDVEPDRNASKPVDDF